MVYWHMPDYSDLGDCEMTDKEAMQMALDALDCIYSPLHVREINKVGEAMAALRAALAQGEQEPVAWKYETPDYVSLQWELTRGDWRDGTWTPLYTAPPQREWQRLTFDEIKAACAAIPDEALDMYEVARAIESKLKEKNT